MLIYSLKELRTCYSLIRQKNPWTKEDIKSNRTKLQFAIFSLDKQYSAIVVFMPFIIVHSRNALAGVKQSIDFGFKRHPLKPSLPPLPPDN